MELSPSAHLDTFCRDRLPPPDQWPEFRFGLPELNYPDRLNCAAKLLDATAASVGYGRPCLSSPAGTWTYGQTIRQTNQLAQVLTEDFGLRPGNRVLLRGPNNPWLAAAWLAVIKAGGVAVTTMADRTEPGHLRSPVRRGSGGRCASAHHAALRRGRSR